MSIVRKFKKKQSMAKISDSKPQICYYFYTNLKPKGKKLKLICSDTNSSIMYAQFLLMTINLPIIKFYWFSDWKVALPLVVMNKTQCHEPEIWSVYWMWISITDDQPAKLPPNSLVNRRLWFAVINVTCRWGRGTCSSK